MSTPAAGAFELWRQDDHGTRFLVGCYPTLDDAERRLAELTRAQHKQSYWITPSISTERTTGQEPEHG
jgi:hypothetical protein